MLSAPAAPLPCRKPTCRQFELLSPHPSWDRLKSVLFDAFKGVGADVELARRLYHDMCATNGLVDVQFRPFIVGVRAGDPMADYLPSTIKSLRGSVFKFGLLTEPELSTLLSECRAHLRNPDTASTLYTVGAGLGTQGPCR